MEDKKETVTKSFHGLTVKNLLVMVVSTLLIFSVWVGVVSVKQEGVWSTEAQTVEDEFKLKALDYINAYNQANPENNITVTQDIIGTYNQHIDTLTGWQHFEEFDASLFSLAVERMGYVAEYNTDLNKTVVGGIRKIVGVEEKPYIEVMVVKEHSQ